MEKSEKCCRRISQWNGEFLEAVRQLSNANCKEALRALDIRTSEANKLLELTCEETQAIAMRASGPIAKKSVDLVALKKTWSLPVNWEVTSDAMPIFGIGKSVATEIIRRVNAAFLMMAKDICIIDRVRAKVWVALSDDEVDLLEHMTVSEILSPNSVFQKRTLIGRSVNLNLLFEEQAPAAFKFHAATIAGNIVLGKSNESISG